MQIIKIDDKFREMYEASHDLQDYDRLNDKSYIFVKCMVKDGYEVIIVVHKHNNINKIVEIFPYDFADASKPLISVSLRNGTVKVGDKLF